LESGISHKQYCLRGKFKGNHKHISLLAFICILSFLSNIIIAQDTIQKRTDDNDIQQQLENITENSLNEEDDYSNLLEGLIYYKEHPVNLNNTSKEELQQLRVLNDIQVNNLLNHIEKNGTLITIYELQTINGFDLQTINKLLPYITVANTINTTHFSLNEMFRQGQNTVIMRYGQTIEKQKGFEPIDSSALFKSPNSRYIGSPQRIYTRYRFTYGNNVSWGITAEKDQGEVFFKDKQNFKYPWYNQSLKGNQHSGFDFYSAHFFVKNIRFIKALAIGDYQATFGQGLTVWSGMSFGKSSDIMSIKKSAQGIRPYTSVDENKFMRGVASTIGFKHFEATGFLSHKKIDATISDTTDEGSVRSISSIQTTGYHTTPSEIANKHSVTQTLTGGNIAYKGRRLSIGITAIDFQLNKNFERSLTYYNQFEFSARHNFNVGLDYNYVFRNFNFFGEQAMSKNGGMAFINGVLISMDARLSITVVQRNYQRNYQNLLSNAFAEGTLAANEKGTYFGISAKPTNTISMTAYYDRFEFPWLKYLVNGPSTGNDYVAQINYIPSKKTEFYFRFRKHNKQKNSSEQDVIMDNTVPVNQLNYRFHISYTILSSVKLKNRVELIDYKNGRNKTEKGYLVYQDVVYNKIGKPLSITLRYAMFQTDSYNARIYAYENDMLSSYSIPAYYSRGSRFYILLDYNLTRNIEIWLRYAQTFYDNQNVISPGSLNEIQGNTRSEIKAQIRFKF
jgi:Helix-hairpin-helix motif